MNKRGLKDKIKTLCEHYRINCPNKELLGCVIHRILDTYNQLEYYRIDDTLFAYNPKTFTQDEIKKLNLSSYVKTDESKIWSIYKVVYDTDNGVVEEIVVD